MNENQSRKECREDRSTEKDERSRGGGGMNE